MPQQYNKNDSDVMVPPRTDSPRQGQRYKGITKHKPSGTYRVQLQAKHRRFYMNAGCTFEIALERHDALMQILVDNNLVPKIDARFLTEASPRASVMNYAYQCYLRGIAERKEQRIDPVCTELSADSVPAELFQELAMLDPDDDKFFDDLMFIFEDSITESKILEPAVDGEIPNPKLAKLSIA